MTDQYQIPDDMTLEDKIAYLKADLKPNLDGRYSMSVTVEAFKALIPTYDAEKEKELKEANDTQIAALEKRLIRTQVIINTLQKRLDPLLAEQRAIDEAAKAEAERKAAEAAKSAPAQITATEGTESAPNKNGSRATVKEKV